MTSVKISLNSLYINQFNIRQWSEIRSMIKTRSYDNIAKYLSTNCSTKYGQETTRTYLDVSSEVIGKKLKLEMSNNNALDCKAKTLKNFNRRF